MKKCQMIVCIVDISGFARICCKKSDEQVFEMLNKFYILVEKIISEVDGKVVKFMGDSALIVFEPEKENSAKQALQDLKTRSDEIWRDFGAECNLNIKSDICHLACGEMGLEKRFDVVGNDLNKLFMRK
ncbi:MAG: adenylate/guanylate cyclase domain-containing protein [Candidatus Cloacimonadales bacterium]|nr:adenylate/guanylate cyclase domain-containing protein [Candidatus Cloacimonadales bacterium]